MDLRAWHGGYKICKIRLKYSFIAQHQILSATFSSTIQKKKKKKKGNLLLQSYIICKGCRMGRSNKVSLWCVALLINTRFRFFFFFF